MIQIHKLHLIALQSPQFPRTVKKVGWSSRSAPLPPAAVNEGHLH
ncbi:MAG: hypothetical protein NTW41_11170 [Verrucomicrobia bacterium]|nr:hypothetical protein [Verrucomicrobiota bacterium]